MGKSYGKSGRDLKSVNLMSNGNLKSEMILDSRSRQPSTDHPLFDDSEECTINDAFTESLQAPSGSDDTRTVHRNMIGLAIRSKSSNISLSRGLGQFSSPALVPMDLNQVGPHRKSRQEFLRSSPVQGDPLPKYHRTRRHRLYEPSMSTDNYSSSLDDDDDDDNDDNANDVITISHSGKSPKKIRNTKFPKQKESFIYHDTASLTDSVGTISKQKVSTPKIPKLNFSGAQFTYNNSPSPGLSDGISRKLSFNAESRSVSPDLYDKPYIYPKSNKAKSISHVRQVSKKVFGDEKQSLLSGPTLGASSSKKYVSAKSTFSTPYPLSPILDYSGSDESELLNEAESLLSSPYRIHDYSRLNKVGRNGSPSYTMIEGNSNSRDSPFRYGSPHDYKPVLSRQQMFFQFCTNVGYFILTCAVLVLLGRLVVLKNCDRSLTHFKIKSLKNILVSDELLLFDIFASSKNSNWQDVNVWNMDIDVFIQTSSDVLDSPAKSSLANNEIAILLGNCTSFLTPLRFKGSFNTDCNGTASLLKRFWHQLTHQDDIEEQFSTGQVKLQKPGSNFKYRGKPLTSDQWNNILGSTFKLIIRGSFEYHLPLIPRDEVVGVSTEQSIVPKVIVY